MNIKEAKSNLLDVLENIDKNKLSLTDLKLYADILKTVSEIHIKSYEDYIAETMSGVANCFGYKPVTVSELKSEV